MDKSSGREHDYISPPKVAVVMNVIIDDTSTPADTADYEGFGYSLRTNNLYFWDYCYGYLFYGYCCLITYTCRGTFLFRRMGRLLTAGRVQAQDAAIRDGQKHTTLMSTVDPGRSASCRVTTEYDEYYASAGILLHETRRGPCDLCEDNKNNNRKSDSLCRINHQYLASVCMCILAAIDDD